MEAKAHELGVGNTLFYMFPQKTFLNSSDIKKAAALTPRVDDRMVADIHSGDVGGVELAEKLFTNANITRAGLKIGAVNAETNANFGSFRRAVSEACDLNDWFNSEMVSADAISNRLHFRAASFCMAAANDFDNWDQGISFFLPNMTFLQPAGYVHQMIDQTWQPSALKVDVPPGNWGAQMQNSNASVISAQRSADGKTLVLRFVNAVLSSDTAIAPPTTLTVHLKGSMAALDFSSATMWTLSSLDSLAANTPGHPMLIAPEKTTLPSFGDGAVLHLLANSYVVVVATSAVGASSLKTDDVKHDDDWPVRQLEPPTVLHVVRVADLGMPTVADPYICRGHDHTPSLAKDCQRYLRLLTVLLSFTGTQLRQSSTQGLFVVDQDPYTRADKADSVSWLKRLLAVRPQLKVVRHETTPGHNVSVWSVIQAINDAGLQQGLRYVKYSYDSPGSPESLNAARMAASRLNATMIDSTLSAEAERAGFRAAPAATVDGVRWEADQTFMTDQKILTDWLPHMKQATLGLEQFTRGGLAPYQSDVAAAWELLSWTPDGNDQSSINANRKAFLRHMVNDSLVFGLSHTDKDESGMVQDTSSDSKILTISEGSMNVALLSSFRTESVPEPKPIDLQDLPLLNKHIVALMMQDGDGLDFELGGETPGMMSGFWETKDRGQVPIGWGLSGQFRDLAQPVVESLYANASRNGLEGYDDFFLQDGYGYFHPGSFSSAARELDAARTGCAAAELNLSTAAFFADTTDPHAWENVERDLEPYARLGKYSAIQMWRQDDGAFSSCYVSNNRSERGAIKWVGDTPTMQLRASLWSGHAGADTTLRGANPFGTTPPPPVPCPAADISRKRPVQPCPKPWFYQKAGPGGEGCVQGCPSMSATRNSTTGRCFCGHPGTPIDTCVTGFGMQCIAGQCMQCSEGPTCSGPRGDWCPGIGQCLTTAGLATLLNKQIVSPSSAAGYSLVHVQGDTKECSESLACLPKLKQLLAPHVQIVGPTILTALVRRHVLKHDDGTGSLQMHHVTSCSQCSKPPEGHPGSWCDDPHCTSFKFDAQHVKGPDVKTIGCSVLGPHPETYCLGGNIHGDVYAATGGPPAPPPKPPPAVAVTIDWLHTVQIWNTTLTLEVVIHPLLDPVIPVAQDIWSSLKAMKVNKARFQNWHPWTRYSVLELEPPMKNGVACAAQFSRTPVGRVLSLDCGAGGGGVIEAIEFASYGQPSGRCDEGSLTINRSCHGVNSHSMIAKMCVGKLRCIMTVPSPANALEFGLPSSCGGPVFLAASARCSVPANRSSWNSTLLSPMLQSFMVATNDSQDVAIDFSTQPCWMYTNLRADQGWSYPDNARQGCMPNANPLPGLGPTGRCYCDLDCSIDGCSHGNFLRDPSGRELARYVGRFAQWLFSGGFTDEAGVFQQGHIFDKRRVIFEVFNEGEHGYNYSQYLTQYSAIFEEVTRVADPERQLRWESFGGAPLFSNAFNPRQIPTAELLHQFLSRSRKNHVPVDFVANHAGLGATNRGDPDTYTAFFSFIDKYAAKYRNWSTVIAADSPSTQLTVDEFSIQMAGDSDLATAASPNAGLPELYWVASSSAFALMAIEFAKAGVSLIGADQLIGAPQMPELGIPLPQYPSVTLTNWTTGRGNARYWTIVLLNRMLHAGDRMVSTVASGADIFAQGFVGMGGAKTILMGNKVNGNRTVLLAKEVIVEFVWMIDVSTGESAATQRSADANAIVLSPFAVAIAVLQPSVQMAVNTSEHHWHFEAATPPAASLKSDDDATEMQPSCSPLSAAVVRVVSSMVHILPTTNVAALPSQPLDLTLAAGESSVARTAVSRRIKSDDGVSVRLRAGSRRGLPLLGFGNEAVLQHVDDPALAAAAAAAGGRALRYPGGAPSNSWDWRLGCCTAIPPNETTPACVSGAWNDFDGYGRAPPATWARYVNRSRSDGVAPLTIFDLNVVESNVSYQLEGLRSLAAAGVEVSMLEFGNELYDGQQNLGKWADGKGYAAAMEPFLAELTAAFPQAKTAVVGSGWWPGMDAGWNKAVLENTSATAATFHFYTALDTHGISEATVAARAPGLLTAAFATANHIHADAEATIPSRLRIWVTEFGHYGSYGRGWATTEIDGTWLEGLYSGAALLLVLATSRVDVVMPYCLVCADQNAPSFTSGEPWGSLVPANATGAVEWSLTPRGAVLSAAMKAVADARKASTEQEPVTMQELTFTAGSPPVLDSGSCGAVGTGAGGYCIHNEMTLSACACQTLCTKTAACLAWQWIFSVAAKDHTMCYLKSAVELSPQPASVSGACERHNASTCVPPLPPPLNRTWVGWAFTRGTKVTSPGRHCHFDRKWQQ
jgi:hypothetical protein